MLNLLDEGDFRELDRWKQLGFYAQPKGHEFITPQQAVNRTMAEAVYGLAWQAVTFLDFLFKDGGLNRYIDVARSVRSTLSEEEHKEFEDEGLRVFNQLFNTTETADK